MRRHAMTLKVH